MIYTQPTKAYLRCKMILIDNRETRSPVPKMLESFKIPVTLTTLEIGDYVVVGPEISVCGSRKTAADYVSSITSNHLSNELTQMSIAYNYCFLAINGSIEDALVFRKMRRETYFEYLSSCYIKRSKEGLSSPISVFQFTTDYDFVNFLKTLHDNVTKNDIYRDIDFAQPKKKDLTIYQQKLQSVTTLPGIGRDRADTLLKEFKSIKKLVNASENEIQNIEGLGKKLSKNIVDYVNNEEIE